jgi:aminoglycoside phosphotransferase family enzyme
VHGSDVVKRLLEEERDDIVAQLHARSAHSDAATERYGKATRIALRWVKNYTELDFRSLGSYTHDQLDEIAAAPEAF